jgi:site-specific DNA-methyltransferase (adenine-specific)
VGIFNEVRRVTKPGGFCAVVIGTVLLKSKHYPVPFDTVSRLVQSGWEFHQDIIWHKCTAGIKRAGVTIQKPYPGYCYPNIMTEYILVFRKPGEPIYQHRTATQKTDAEYPINRVFTMDVANNVWHIAPVPPDVIDHPCPFPEEIPFRLITMYSYPGELVLDPFAGSGQTLKVANALNRNYVGYETTERYLELCKRRISEPLSIRDKQLIAVFEKIPFDEPITGARSGNRRSGKPSEAGETAHSQTLLFEPSLK